MPYHLELGSDGHSFKGKAIVVNTATGKHYSKSPITLEKAKAQKRILEQADGNSSSNPGADANSSGSKKFIQEVVTSPNFRKGAFTAKAKKHGMSALEHMEEVLAHPEDYDVRTRKQAQFLFNIQRK